MTETKMVKLFIDAQEPPYYEKLTGSIGKSFSEIIQQVETVERGLKSGKLIDMTAFKFQIESMQGSTSVAKKPLSKKADKKKEEVTFIFNQPNRQPPRNFHQYQRPNPQPFYAPPPLPPQYYPQLVYQTQVQIPVPNP
ncbi:hypothetical protein ACH5RR_021957 [Cinchona calisaya]|uniref:Uncharacterized protein n=1 Tax=Cinchona calisaya TaxID=153742 RepID=A0ABD2Z9U7_9GENT